MLVRYSLTHLETISQSITCYKFSVCKVGRTLVRKFFDEPCCHARQSCASQREGTSIQQEEQQNKKFLTTWSLTTLHGMFTVWPIYRQWIAFFFHRLGIILGCISSGETDLQRMTLGYPGQDCQESLRLSIAWESSLSEMVILYTTCIIFDTNALFITILSNRVMVEKAYCVK